MGFGPGGLAEVVDLAVVAVEHDGDPLLAGELVAQALPTEVNVLGLEPDAQAVDQVVGQHRDEQMAVDPGALVVVDGTQAQLRFQRAEHRLQIGEHDIGLPQGGLVPIALIGAQAIGNGAASRINIVSLAINKGLTIDDLLQSEMAYCPAVSEVNDILLKACEFAKRRMK